MNLWGIFFWAIGLFTSAGGIFDWDWFMNYWRARFMCKLLGRTGARVLYVLMGVVFCVLGTMVLLGLLQVHDR